MSEFGVDLRGVIDLLSRHIYSGPEVFLRELLQNSRDALIARADHQPLPSDWAVRIRPARDGHPFVLSDDGIGLEASEVEDLLATVGRSSKKDMLDLPNQDFLGHFGIGLLSCFMVADVIDIVSRKQDRLAVQWRGLADGTFTVTELTQSQTEALPLGTRVVLTPMRDRETLLAAESVERLVRHYGEYLPVPVYLEGPEPGTARLMSAPAPFVGAVDEALLEYGEQLLGHRPFDAIPLHIPGTATEGVAYVLGHPASGRSRSGARVYIGRMLLSPDEDSVVPEWAFFLRPVLTSDGLTPTASRESLVRDEALSLTKDGIADAVRAWVSSLAWTHRPRLAQFLSTHDLAIRAACVDDDELFRIVGPFLTFETAAGSFTLEQIVRQSDGRVAFAPSLDEFRMLTGLGAQGVLVNGSYVHHEELLLKAPHLFAGVEVERADVMARLTDLADPALEDRPRTDVLAARATQSLAVVDVEAVVKVLPEPTVASLYVADAQVLQRADMRRATEVATGPWAAALRRAGDHVDQVRARQGATATRAQVCLNWASPLVQRLAVLEDREVLDRSVRLLYVQALLAGRRPLTEADRTLMSQSLDDLITLSVGLDPTLSPSTDAGPGIGTLTQGDSND